MDLIRVRFGCYRVSSNNGFPGWFIQLKFGFGVVVWSNDYYNLNGMIENGFMFGWIPWNLVPGMEIKANKLFYRTSYPRMEYKNE